MKTQWKYMLFLLVLTCKCKMKNLQSPNRKIKKALTPKDFFNFYFREKIEEKILRKVCETEPPV